jgi:uncharacterized protein (DUF302 family)
MAVTMEFTYRREGSKGFLETVEAVERSVRSRGFAIVGRHDLQERLAAKGFEIQPAVIIEVATDSEDTALCKIHVYAESGAVWVTAIRPSLLWRVVDSGDIPIDDAESSVVALVDAAVL